MSSRAPFQNSNPALSVLKLGARQRFFEHPEIHLRRNRNLFSMQYLFPVKKETLRKEVEIQAEKEHRLSTAISIWIFWVIKMSRSEETFREAVPAHVLFKIEAFSLLPKNALLKYESNEFEAGGYKWRLSFYPCGNTNENGNGHISLYLALVDTYLPASWELNVSLRLFLFDQIRDRYLIRGDVDGKTSRFHELKKVHGFPQFISLEKFKHPSNGYLVDDSCVFGAEVFVSKPMGNIECLSMIKQSTTVNHTWKIENFSKITQEVLRSQNFKAGDLNWNVHMYPKGNSVGKRNNSVSLYLTLAEIRGKPGLKVYVDFKLRIRDQINGIHMQMYQGKHWFHALCVDWGWNMFIGLSALNDKEKGFLVNDTCIVEAEVEVLGKVTKHTPSKKRVPRHQL